MWKMEGVVGQQSICVGNENGFQVKTGGLSLSHGLWWRSEEELFSGFGLPSCYGRYRDENDLARRITTDIRTHH